MPTNDNPKPDNTIVIVADDGNLYKLDEAFWKQGQKIDNPGAVGIVRELEQFGSVVAYLKRDFAGGYGTCCTVLNLNALKRS
jgi:hypothetical protein